MLSKKSHYALQALMYLAENEKRSPIQIAEIAAHRKLPLKFLEAIMVQLKKGGIVSSKKGHGGGYYFETSPSLIPLARVLRLLEGPIALLPCVSLNFYERCKNCDETSCGLHDMMAKVRDATLKILEKKTVADIADL